MTAPVRKSVELFYDVISPYSWIAFEVLCRYNKRWNMDLKLKPFFLGGIMQGSGNKPPALVANKAQYMIHDLNRLANYYAVPINLQSFATHNDVVNSFQDFFHVMFTKGSLSAGRYITAVDMKKPEYTEQVSRELWFRIWNRDEDATDSNSLRQAGKKAGLSDDFNDECVEKVKDQAVKDRLKHHTQEALDLGAFGSPTIIANINNKKELIFGTDRFLILASMLGEEWQGPLVELSKCKDPN
ncbi:hypothetical protein KUTeg_001422 [Tegillarca granosa]|uniref:Glutathione S-transferase kappa n=1 Tax=Tegillarca granosa TaxID=220873 RepID=A0ABQ9FRH3_TEGGR|nr:hypothetical protein KUTeg_001422 [Tegillarca granosa]